MENDINIPPPVQTEPIPVQPENSFIKRNFTPKFVAVIVMIIVLGGIAYSYTTYLAKKNFDEISRLAVEGKKQEEELKQRRLDNSSDVADWQTYRNEKYGYKYGGETLYYELRYLDGWTMEEGSGGVTFSKPQNQCILSFGGSVASITTAGYSQIEMRDVSIGDFVVKVTIFKNNLSVAPQYRVLAFLDKGLEMNGLISMSDTEICTGEFNKILSTFKFIEPAP